MHVVPKISFDIFAMVYKSKAYLCCVHATLKTFRILEHMYNMTAKQHSTTASDSLMRAEQTDRKKVLLYRFYKSIKIPFGNVLCSVVAFAFSLIINRANHSQLLLLLLQVVVAGKIVFCNCH